jgi:isoleucyl-tRNA synthetase
LDRWILSELNRTVAAVTELMDAYDNFGACTRINEFVDALSNWYVRRSRDRFWSGDKRSTDKLDGYRTLYECLVSTSKLIAPFTPFLAEALWQNLAGVFGGRAPESVHLCDYPTCDDTAIDATLSERMQLLRDIASLGRKARMDAKLKVRQPLAKVEVILADDKHQGWLESHDALLRDELNVKQIDYAEEAEHYISYEVLPNFKRLGPRLGRLMPKVKQALVGSDGGRLLAELESTGKVVLEVEGQRVGLDSEDIQVRLQAKPGWAAAHLPSCVVVLSTDLTPELLREGLARDLVRLIQDRRKDLNCEYTDRIQVGVVTSSDELRRAIQENAEYIRGETLAAELVGEALPNAEGIEHEVAGERVRLFVSNASGR